MGTLPPPILIAGALSWPTTRSSRSSNFVIPWERMRVTVALIIDAMDLLHTRELGGFCLVSSDSDFTRLATRIREDGLPVYGFGEEKTPRSFINACDRFIYTEIFRTKTVSSAK